MKRYKSTIPEKIFYSFNYTLLAILAFISLIPIINILAVSLSSKFAAATGVVTLYPVQFTTSAYEFVLANDNFISSFLVSIRRVLIGVPLNAFLICLTAYPLSLKDKEFKGRSVFSWFFMLSLIFNGGLIPTYLTVNAVGLVDNFLVLILPMAVPIYYVILMRNFYLSIPEALKESAFIDGAGHATVFFRIYLPLSKTGIATIALLCFIFHWNSWFDGLLYIGETARQPLQSYLQAIISKPINVNALATNPEQWRIVSKISEQTLKSAQIFISTLPIMIVYPFAQKYFTKGILVGSIKG